MMFTSDIKNLETTDKFVNNDKETSNQNFARI